MGSGLSRGCGLSVGLLPHILSLLVSVLGLVAVLLLVFLPRRFSFFFDLLFEVMLVVPCLEFLGCVCSRLKVSMRISRRSIAGIVGYSLHILGLELVLRLLGLSRMVIVLRIFQSS